MGDAVADDSKLTQSNTTQDMRPEHKRVIALRVQGRSWGEIAAALGCTPWTIWSWRQSCPEIDAEIARQSSDMLDTAAHGLAALLPLTVKALGELLDCEDYRVRLGAAKVVLDALKRQDRAGQLPAQVEAYVRQARELTPAELQGELERRHADSDVGPSD